MYAEERDIDKTQTLANVLPNYVDLIVEYSVVEERW